MWINVDVPYYTDNNKWLTTYNFSTNNTWRLRDMPTNLPLNSTFELLLSTGKFQLGSGEHYVLSYISSLPSFQNELPKKFPKCWVTNYYRVIKQKMKIFVIIYFFKSLLENSSAEIDVLERVRSWKNNEVHWKRHLFKSKWFFNLPLNKSWEKYIAKIKWMPNVS